MLASGRQSTRLWIRGGYTPRLCAAKSAIRNLLGKIAAPPGESNQREAYMRAPGRRRFWLHMAVLDLYVECLVRVRWLGRRGRCVLCDRYLDDTEIDFAIHFPDDHVNEWPSWRLLRRLAPKPDHAFLLDLSFQDSARRSLEKGEPFPEDDQRRRMRACYYDVAKQKIPWRLLDALRTVDQLHCEVVSDLGYNVVRSGT